jgi:hypothetical protein
MSNLRQLSLTSLKEKGKGWERLDFENPGYAGSYESLVILSPGHEKGFLGEGGWQGAEAHLRISFEILDTTTVSLYLPPPIVQYLDYGFNYQFQLFSLQRHMIGEMIVRWTGRSYRPPGGKIPVIDIIMPDDAPGDPLTIGVRPLAQDGALIARSTPELDEMETPEACVIVNEPATVVLQPSSDFPDVDPDVSEPEVPAPPVFEETGSTTIDPWEPNPTKLTRALCPVGHEMIIEVGYCVWCGRPPESTKGAA